MITTSKYARIYDKTCSSWTNNREYNELYLRSVENYFNDLLKERGYVFLKDVYEKLGFRPSKESIFVGWYLDYENKFVDNYIDFGLKLNENVDGPNLVLDFNVDGDITKYF